MAQLLVVNACDEDEDEAGLGACGVHSPGGAENNEQALNKLFTSPSSESSGLVFVAAEKTGSLANARGGSIRRTRNSHSEGQRPPK